MSWLPSCWVWLKIIPPCLNKPSYECFGKLQTAKLCTKQALARSNTIQEISCDSSWKMWFMRKEPQSSFCFSMRWIIPKCGSNILWAIPTCNWNHHWNCPFTADELGSWRKNSSTEHGGFVLHKTPNRSGRKLLTWLDCRYSISLRESLPLISSNGKSSNVQVTDMKSVDLAAILCRWL